MELINEPLLGAGGGGGGWGLCVHRLNFELACVSISEVLPCRCQNFAVNFAFSLLLLKFHGGRLVVSSSFHFLHVTVS